LKNLTGADAGSIGPVGFNGKIIADLCLKDANNMYSGANKDDYHLGGIDFLRDVKNIEYYDLRSVRAGEQCIVCGNKLEVFTAIELGHIFKLGTKYSDALGANFLDENGEAHPIIMGSYGIGVDRILACYLEQHHDENGIVWENILAPFHVHLIGLNMRKKEVAEASEKIYSDLSSSGIEALFDDRPDAQAGFKFNDADLLGMPLQVIVGEKKLKENKVEIKVRKTGKREDANLNEIVEKIKSYF
jgi:prolyl-tRNA synthetase